jgi:F-type H+-transporting ATPase subunit gamma
MPSLKTIRNRINSVKSTQKITRAMKMVAGARLARAQQRIVALRPYAVKTAEVLRDVTAEVAAKAAEAENRGEAAEAPHPLLVRRPEKKVLFIILTSDRGLCGAFNSNINRAVEREWRTRQDAGQTLELATIGRKGRDYFQRRKATITRDFARLYEGLDMHSAKLVSSWLVPRYAKGEWDAVYLVYNEFRSAISQKTQFERLLPLPDSDDEPVTASIGGQQAQEFLFEPTREALLDRLVPLYVELSIFRALLESQASEFGARMTAMDAATRNAKEMIEKLTLQYNRARQAAITKELMEIIGGAEALKD